MKYETNLDRLYHAEQLIFSFLDRENYSKEEGKSTVLDEYTRAELSCARQFLSILLRYRLGYEITYQINEDEK